MNDRLLIIGTGASIEECVRIGADALDHFPTISNFGNKLFDESPILQQVTAAYLESNSIEFNPKMLEIYATAKGGEKIDPEVYNSSPLRVFLRLEKENPARHNVERLFEYTWNVFPKNNYAFWGSLMHSAVYLQLSLLFIKHFGLSGVPGKPFKDMKAGEIICKVLTNCDRVINLNYDIVFDIAIKQSGKPFCYAPKIETNSIAIYKPHGSFNLYCNYFKKQFQFVDPYDYGGTLTYPDSKGGKWDPTPSIIPPRLNKS